MNPVGLTYCPFMISLNKCAGSYSLIAKKVHVPKETEDISVTEFNMIANKDEAKAMTEHISCDYKCKFNSTKSNSKQKLNNKTCQCECNNYSKCKENYCWNPGTCIHENRKYLKGVEWFWIIYQQKEKNYSNKC